jgi:hypothetical protein
MDFQRIQNRILAGKGTFFGEKSIGEHRNTSAIVSVVAQ